MPELRSFPFSLRFRWDDSKPQVGELLRIGRTLRFVVREAGDDPELERWDRDQNYARYPLADGRVLAIEAILALEAESPHRRLARVGCPLGFLRPGQPHEIVLKATAAVLELSIDGRVVDEQWPVDPLKPGDGEIVSAASVSGASVEPSADIDLDAQGRWRIPQIQYFTPPGFNDWVGDTMCLAHDGVFHLFYLYDRRHGSSKFGCGGHQIAHASSRDLKTWTHHPLAVPIIAPWMTCGTGIPIVQDGRILLFFGLHTDRAVSKEQTSVPRIEQTLAQTGQTEPVAFGQDGLVPMGTVVATTEDGVHYTIDPTVIHHCQNPSPFVHPTTGRVYLLAGYGDEGCYETDDLRHWRLVDKHFLPNVRESAPGNTLECQCYFEWNGWHYLIAGRTGFWMSRNPLGPYWEGAKNADSSQITRPRWDPYDGLWVPTVASWAGNRRILAGWIAGPDVEWAGHLVFREFVQEPDGTLGTKWVEQLIPRCGKALSKPKECTVIGIPKHRFERIAELPDRCRITMVIGQFARQGSYGVRIGKCELKLIPATGRAQWHQVSVDHGPTPDVPVLEEILATEPYQPIWSHPHPNIHFKGGDFAIQNVQGLDGMLTLDLIVHYDPKRGGTLIDACIDNRRTIITFRPGMRPGKLRAFADRAVATFTDIVIRPII